jgi:hypothetical protein
MENHHFNGKIHYKWSFSIAMLNYQRVLWFYFLKKWISKWQLRMWTRTFLGVWFWAIVGACLIVPWDLLQSFGAGIQCLSWCKGITLKLHPAMLLPHRYIWRISPNSSSAPVTSIELAGSRVCYLKLCLIIGHQFWCDCIASLDGSSNAWVEK